jgi:purine nucleoside phosphorylase
MIDTIQGTLDWVWGSGGESVSFEQSINHDYRFNTSYSTPNEEYPIMQAYVTECHEKRKQGFFQFHRNYHRAVP